jgi:hypothetical protein
MNNKYLAVALSIIAVVVVVYQVFLRKTTTSIKQQLDQPREQAESLYSPQGRPGQPVNRDEAARSPQSSTAAVPGSLQRKEAGSGAPIIDYSSEVLLKRIDPQWTLPYPQKELSSEFKTKLFSRGKQEKEKPAGPRYEREVEFKLNAIIIDDTRHIAIINDKILKTGEMIEGAEVVSIAKSRVVLKFKGETFELSTNSRIKKVRYIGGKGE